MDYSDPHTRLRPTVIERTRNLPADIVNAREVRWLGELQTRLEAVHAWRGHPRTVSAVPPRSANNRDH